MTGSYEITHLCAGCGCEIDDSSFGLCARCEEKIQDADTAWKQTTNPKEEDHARR